MEVVKIKWIDPCSVLSAVPGIDLIKVSCVVLYV